MAQARLEAVLGDHEFDRDDIGALMEKLEEGVLAVGAGLAPDDRPGGARDRRTVHDNALAVRFHVELLQIGRETAEPLVIGNDGARAVAEDIALVIADQPEQQRDVAVEGSGAEMVVHRMRAFEEMREIVLADGDHQRQADRRPDRIAAADPVPEAEDP